MISGVAFLDIVFTTREDVKVSEDKPFIEEPIIIKCDVYDIDGTKVSDMIEYVKPTFYPTPTKEYEKRLKLKGKKFSMSLQSSMMTLFEFLEDNMVGKIYVNDIDTEVMLQKLSEFIELRIDDLLTNMEYTPYDVNETLKENKEELIRMKVEREMYLVKSYTEDLLTSWEDDRNKIYKEIVRLNLVDELKHHFTNFKLSNDINPNVIRMLSKEIALL